VLRAGAPGPQRARSRALAAAASQTSAAAWLPAAGAPPSNTTFVPNDDGSLYYSYVARRANFTNARAACTRMDGSLVMWRSADSQYAVERHLYRAGVLAKYYWLGIARPRQGAPFAFVDGSSVPNLVSNSKPYAHWAWTQPAYAQAVAYGCALAWQDLAYDEYKSADRNTSALAAMANYNTDPRYAAFKYGWTAYDCAIAYPYICQIPAANFPCNPPPSPPAPPPLPPSPPSPPAPPSCEQDSRDSCDVEMRAGMLMVVLEPAACADAQARPPPTPRCSATRQRTCATCTTPPRPALPARGPLARRWGASWRAGTAPTSSWLPRWVQRTAGCPGCPWLAFSMPRYFSTAHAR
jgi:hypothetical protein